MELVLKFKCRVFPLHQTALYLRIYKI